MQVSAVLGVHDTCMRLCASTEYTLAAALVLTTTDLHVGVIGNQIGDHQHRHLSERIRSFA
jgi:hypothetical protein